jgi:hypothetical protein
MILSSSVFQVVLVSSHFRIEDVHKNLVSYTKIKSLLRYSSTSTVKPCLYCMQSLLQWHFILCQICDWPLQRATRKTSYLHLTSVKYLSYDSVMSGKWSLVIRKWSRSSICLITYVLKMSDMKNKMWFLFGERPWSLTCHQTFVSNLSGIQMSK